MELINGLYTVESALSTEEGFDYLIRFNPSHFIYAAHFPGEPITPGVCILQACIELLEISLSSRLSVECVKNVKFLKVITPTETSQVYYRFRSLKQLEDVVSAQCTVATDEETFAKISLVCRRQTGQN